MRAIKWNTIFMGFIFGVAFLLIALAAGAHVDGGVDEPWSAAMNDETYWEDRFGEGTTCTKYEPHNGSIPPQYEAAVSKGGTDVRVYIDPPSQILGPHGNNGKHRDISWVMKCNIEPPVESTTTTVSDSTTTTITEETTTTAQEETTTTVIEATTTTQGEQTTTTSTEVTTTLPDGTSSTTAPSVSTTVVTTTTTAPTPEPPAELPFTGTNTVLLLVAAMAFVGGGAAVLRASRRAGSE